MRALAHDEILTTAVCALGDDARVDPLHARTMPALVQARNASAEPILIRYYIRAGHAAAPPIRDVIDMIVDTLGFMAWQLELELE